MDERKYKELKMGEKGAYLSIIAYICLSALKLIIGYVSHSEALKADGLNNTTDIIASIAVLIGLKLSQRPADADHPYGHWKSETVASMVASFIMMSVGLQVSIEAILSFIRGKDAAPDLIAAWTGIFCTVVIYVVYRYNRNLARKINSQSVMAAAKDNLSDAWVSVGTAIGILGAQFHLPWLDPLAAIIVGFLICKTAWDIFREASHQLTDGFDQKQIESYKDIILEVDGVNEIKSIKARKYGNNTVVDAEIMVNSAMDVSTAHDVATTIENLLKNNHEVYDVHIHVEPMIKSEVNAR